jgi:hypothetical protein
MSKFKNETTPNINGELRTVEESDGWYVVGEGLYIPISSEDEGIQLIREIKLAN